MHLPQRTQRVNRCEMSGLLSLFARLLDFFRHLAGLTPRYWYMDCSSHFPYFGHPVQSSGCVASISSIAVRRTLSASGPFTVTFIPSLASVMQEGTAPSTPSISTEQRRHPPFASRSGWLQRCGMKMPASSAASRTDWPSLASISFPSIVIRMYVSLFA